MAKRKTSKKIEDEPIACASPADVADVAPMPEPVQASTPPGAGADQLPPDQEERRAILEELDVCMLVEAAAGAGKTTSMVGRMVALLGEGKLSVDTLAAVTFTRKAAAELRSRFQLELERQARQSEGPACERLSHSLRHVDRCFIGTIHSFCARLLRERPVEAGVDLDFVELDDATDERLRDEAWQEYVAGLFATSHECLAELDELGLTVSQLTDGFRAFASYPDVDEWPAPAVELPDLRPFAASLRDYAEHMAKLVPTFPEDTGNDELMDAYRRVARQVSQAELDRPRDLMELLELFRKKKIVQKNWPGKKDQAKAEEESWLNFVDNIAKPLVRQWHEKRYEAILRVLRPAVAVYDRLRREAGGLNFQDLLLQSAALLRDKPGIREYFRKRWTHLLIDEFQDTDPVQAEVMLLLTANNPAEVNWRRCRPRPGSLFVVGDPKQSIYRFRRADIVTYNQVRDIIASNGGRLVSLSANFRTVRPLVDWLNTAFDRIFPDVADSYSPSRAPMLVGRTEKAAGQLLGLTTLAPPDDLSSNQLVLEWEADFIARSIRRRLDEGHHVPRTRKELERGVAPQATPGDFLIVTVKKANMTLYARKLQEQGIPHQVTGGAALNEVRELALLHACLKAVVDPDDAVALVAVLRGELFGISDVALYDYRRTGGRFSYRAKVPESLPPHEAAPLADAFGRLKQYDRWLKRLPVVSACERIAADLGLWTRAAAFAGGAGQVGSFAKAIELLRAAQWQGNSPADLVAYLGLLVEQTEKHDGVPARPDDSSVVRIMNLHKAKGLEAPVVFLADPTGDSEHGVSLHVDRTDDKVRGYLAFHEDRRRLAVAPTWDEREEEEAKFQRAEKNRLFYVAATRVGCQLVVSQRGDRNRRYSPWKFFEEHLADCPKLPDPGEQLARIVDTFRVGDDELPAAKGAIEARWSAVTAPTHGVAAAKKVSISATGLGPSLAEHGTEWGTVIHRLLETKLLEPTADLRELAAASFREVELDDPAMVDAALETVDAVFASDIWRRASTSPHRLVELPFETLAATTDTTGVPLILRGVIDLIFREVAGWVIVDYKTDRRGEGDLNALVEHYRGQIDAYADYWEKLVGQPVIETGLFFTHFNKYVVVSNGGRGSGIGKERGPGTGDRGKTLRDG